MLPIRIGVWPDSIQVLDEIASAYGAGGCLVFLRSLGGAFGRVDPAATAFAHRGAEALVVSGAFLPLDASEDQMEDARTMWRTIGDSGQVNADLLSLGSRHD